MNSASTPCHIWSTRIINVFITGFEFYLRSIEDCSAVTAAKYMKHFLKTINLVLAHRWINENPFELYKNKVKAKEKQFLTADELERIKLKDFRIPRLNHVELCKSSSILKQSLGIQVEDEKEMVYRMGEYSIMLMRRYQLPIKQYVVFLKDIKPLMPTFLAEWISS